MKTLTRVIIALVALLVVVSKAQAATLSLSPPSTKVGQGQSFTVSINVNTGGEAVNAVEVTLSFPSDKLKANSISHSGSAFDINAESTIGNGIVRIAKGKIPPAVVGSRRVASVSFNAQSQGAATIAILGDSKVLKESDSSNILSGTGSTAVTIGAPGTGKPKVTGQPGQEGQPEVKDTTPPKITDVKVTNLSKQSATITWRTDEPADSTVQYGLDTQPLKYSFTVSSQELVTEHSITLDPKTIIGHLYHFSVSSRDKDGNLSNSPDSTFVTQSQSSLLEVRVLDPDSKGVAGAKVRLPSIGVEQLTDQNGLAVFKDLPPGTYSLVVEYKDEVKTASANVAGDRNSATVVLAQRTSQGRPLLITGVILLVVTIIAGVLLFRYWKQTQSPNVSNRI